MGPLPSHLFTRDVRVPMHPEMRVTGEGLKVFAKKPDDAVYRYCIWTLNGFNKKT